MESKVMKAYVGIYCSTKEILFNNHRHLFCNTLDLLSRAIKTTAITETFLCADQIRFWFTDILPLLFDDDIPIQTSAIIAFSIFLESLEVKNIHKAHYWKEVKATVYSYALKIHELRDTQNPNWFKIWCIFLSILDNEIFKHSSTINLFLSIVELGFRSLYYSTRCEAFLCWRHLIEILSRHNKLCSRKFLTLLSIPLKSSEQRTYNVTEIKIRVWWCLISKLSNVNMNFSTIVQPFFRFLFTSYTRLNNSNSIKELVLICITAIVTKRRNVFIDNNLKILELELVPSNFIDTITYENHWDSILCSIIETFKIMEMKLERDQIILQILLQNIFHHISQCKTSIYEFFVDKLAIILNEPSSQVLHIITSSINFKRCNNEYKNYAEVLTAFIKFFIAKEENAQKVIMQKCVNEVVALNLFGDKNIDRIKFAIIFKAFLQGNTIETIEHYETKLVLWMCVSRNYAANIEKINKGYKMSIKIEEDLSSWILWPLQAYISFEGNIPDFPSCFDALFYSIWNQLLHSVENFLRNRTFFMVVAYVFQDILLNKEPIPKFSILFDYPAQSLLKTPYIYHEKKLFELFDQWILSNKECFNAILYTFKNTLRIFSSEVFNMVIEDVKKTLILIMQPNNLKYISKHVLEKFKRVLFKKLEFCPIKNYLKQFEGIFQNNELFVTIHSVWSLNPDKLTDNQKEMLRKQSDIPALYNDLSISQESFMKPWTPKKIVMDFELNKNNNENLKKENLPGSKIPITTTQNLIGVLHSNKKPTTSNLCEKCFKLDEYIFNGNKAFLKNTEKGKYLKNNIAAGMGCLKHNIYSPDTSCTDKTALSSFIEKIEENRNSVSLHNNKLYSTLIRNFDKIDK